MNVSKYCDDYLLFDVHCEINQFPNNVVRQYLFPIGYTEKDVQKALSDEKFNLKITHIEESGYALKLKDL
ncbi:hypothetical protein G7081_07065 [Vagococcus coleopterorum]|uniref:Uncharacterized protein n=1 Tax=Vagococcus coleopterorum TaxID=2714946 RepID=A0A6G8APB7_9ENTE|nr:hypothetical protein [Vagococcus coleopterorum]QIL46846.1 hypothetical protein G7081_07065 [Vagococcus coleopterorum]